MIRLISCLVFYLLLIATADSAEQSSASAPKTELPTRIAFGSCADQEKPQPVLGKARERGLDFSFSWGTTSTATAATCKCCETNTPSLVRNRSFNRCGKTHECSPSGMIMITVKMMLGESTP